MRCFDAVSVIRQDAGLEDINPENVFAPAPYALKLIQERNLRPFMLSKPSLLKEVCVAHASAPLSQASLTDSLRSPCQFPGIETAYPNAVVVADAEDNFTHASMTKAFRILMEDDSNAFFALGTNRYVREPEGLSLDVGSYVAALEYATGRKAEVIGKPAAGFFSAAAESMGLAQEDCVMVGDDVVTDVEGAQASGMKGILVRTGKYMDGDETAISPAPFKTVDDLEAAVDLIVAHNEAC